MALFDDSQEISVKSGMTFCCFCQAAQKEGGSGSGSGSSGGLNNLLLQPFAVCVGAVLAVVPVGGSAVFFVLINTRYDCW